MNEVTREQLNAAIEILSRRINALDRRVSLLPDPFSKLSMMQVQRGGTGAARIRRLPLHLVGASDGTGDTFVRDTHGSLSNATHFELPDATTDIYFESVMIPSDYVNISFSATINWLYSNEGTSGTVKWDPLIRSFKDGSSSLTNLYNSDFLRTVPSVANTIELVSVELETVPEKDSFIVGYIRRSNSGSPTNSDNSHLWCAWIEYVAFI